MTTILPASNLAEPIAERSSRRAIGGSARGGSARSGSARSPGRKLRQRVLQVPQQLRVLVRADELWLVLLAAVVGAVAGLIVVAMNQLTLIAHDQLFHLTKGERLSGAYRVELRAALLVPSIGGLLLGLSGLCLARFWPRRAVDPIEANALYGGQMSLVDSFVVVCQTLLSNSVGASIGLEAGYTQMGAAVASKFGRSFRVRRNDLRLLVGCGAAAAISAAFNAPLTGAFYGFELVIGAYTLATLAPVVVAAICGVLVARLLQGDEPGFVVHLPAEFGTADFLPVLVLGVLCALLGICIMRGVTLTEMLFRRSRVPGWARPAIGGLAVGGLALLSPAVLSSGHAALRQGLDAPYSLQLVALLLVLKAIASAISIGSGFRGGLFFASLFLGALVGKLFGGLLLLTHSTLVQPEVVYALIGMSATAVAIIGGPLTMTFLALESTGSLPITVAVLAAAVISAITVRRTFGYSFATWRFHLRGEAIRSAVDIGWMRNLTVGRMMRREIRTVRADTSLAHFRRDFPLGAEKRVIVVDDAGRYAGLALPSEAHATNEDEASTVADLLQQTHTILLPQMSVKEAAAMFERAEADALAVVENAEGMRVIGILSEQHALRRYAEELERRRRDLSGE